MYKELNMSDKDKWKTYPCKYCIVKSTCTRACFTIPWLSSTSRYRIHNNSGNICTACSKESCNIKDFLCPSCWIKFV